MPAFSTSESATSTSPTRAQRACGDLLDELDNVTVVLTPTRWLGWDMAGLLEILAARGADLEQPETWFRRDE
jgi:hypothetical protein